MLSRECFMLWAFRRWLNLKIKLTRVYLKRTDGQKHSDLHILNVA